jgi:hypothetical protein
VHLLNTTLYGKLNEVRKATKEELAAVKYEQEQLLLSEASANKAISFYWNKYQSLVARDCRWESLGSFQAAASLMS